MQKEKHQSDEAAASPEALARGYFPRGLAQPAGSFRFSADALLLAEFAASESARPLRGLDLGCGCGVVGLGVMLKMPAARFTGIDIDERLTAAARENAVRLGLAARYLALCADLNQYKNIPEIRPGSFDFVVANPPYRRAGSGRLSPENLRNSALFESNGELDIFISAAARALKNSGRFFCVYSAERLPELCAALAANKLTPKRIRPVHSKAGGAALLVLLEARLNARPGLKWEPPFYLCAFSVG